MSKTVSEHLHDYAVSAFSLYAKCHRPAHSDIAECAMSSPTLDDLAAADRAMMRLREEDEGDISVRCVEMVYLTSPQRTHRGDLSCRVTRACHELSISESTAYRILSRARTYFARERGLRLGDDDDCAIDLFA